MKNTLLLLALSMASLMMFGCGSTDKGLPSVNGELVYPSMPILVKEPYVWDDSKSEAYNIASMAKPAGIALSLRDQTDGKKASIGDFGALGGVADAALNLASGNVFGVFQDEATRQGVNKKSRFNPTIVDFVEKDKVYINDEPNYKLVRNYIAAKIQKAVEQDYPNIKWGGVYSLYDGKKKEGGIPKFDAVLLVQSHNECIGIRQSVTGNQITKPFVTKAKSIFIDGENTEATFCSVSFAVNAVSIKDENVIVTAELKYGDFFVPSMINNYSGYVIIPDIHYPNSKKPIRRDYAFVSKNGKELLFETP